MFTSIYKSKSPVDSFFFVNLILELLVSVLLFVSPLTVYLLRELVSDMQLQMLQKQVLSY